MSIFHREPNENKSHALEVKVKKLEFEKRNLFLLQEITNVLVSDLDFESISQKIVNLVVDKFHYIGGILFNKEKDVLRAWTISETKTLRITLTLLPKKFRDYSTPLVKSNKNYMSRTVMEKKVLTSQRLANFVSPPVPKSITYLTEKITGCKATIALPIIIKKEVIGALMFSSKKREFTKEEIEILKTFTQQAGIAISNARMYDRIKRQMMELDKMTDKLAATNIRLKGAYKKLQKLDKAKSEFISIASHQLRTPLTSIKGYISMLLEGDYGKLPKGAIKSMDNVYLSNERLIKLVNSLLDISRIEAGKMKLEKTVFSIEDLIAELGQEFKPQAEEKGIKLQIKEPKAEIPKIKADKQKIRQVLMNLLDNAIKYTLRGEVFVKLESAKDKLRIIVADTGEGMTKEEISKIFQSFSRAEAGKRFWVEGAGLGLYVGKKFIDMHHGKIWAKSEGKGRGSTFYVELPIL